MNMGLFGGYFGEQKIIGTQYFRSPMYSNYSSMGYFISPKEATMALISAECGSNGSLYWYVDNTDTGYHAGAGGAACYRVVFPLTDNVRHIPYYAYNPGGNSSTLYIGSDGTGNYDVNPAYGRGTLGLPCVILNHGPGGVAGGGGGDAIYIDRQSNQTAALITAPGGAIGAGGAGGDGVVRCVPRGGIIAGGAGSGTSAAGDGGGGYSPAGTRGGNVPAPWGTMYGGNIGTDRGTPNIPGDGATLFRHGNTWIQGMSSWNIPGYKAPFGVYTDSSWIICEFI
jgi:hypothetical protein